MSESERRFFKLGAKDAIIEKIDSLQFNADAVKRLFGKNGDVKKLKLLFDDDNSFKRFNDTLQREADFVLTRRAAQANSTTAKQISDDVSASEVINATTQAISTPAGAANVVGRIMGGLSKSKSSQEYTKALEDAGDVLLAKGVNSETIQSILKSGSRERITSAIRSATKSNSARIRSSIPAIVGATDAQSAPEKSQTQTQ
jgi:UDP-N-acetylmuramoylalanine-D-glutamate ligase